MRLFPILLYLVFASFLKYQEHVDPLEIDLAIDCIFYLSIGFFVFDLLWVLYIGEKVDSSSRHFEKYAADRLRLSIQFLTKSIYLYKKSDQLNKMTTNNLEQFRSRLDLENEIEDLLQMLDKHDNISNQLNSDDS